jgi:hypothetical protein
LLMSVRSFLLIILPSIASLLAACSILPSLDQISYMRLIESASTYIIHMTLIGCVVKPILRYLQFTASFGLHLRRAGVLSAYSDVYSAVSPDDHRSMGGYTVFFGLNLIARSASFVE